MTVEMVPLADGNDVSGAWAMGTTAQRDLGCHKRKHRSVTTLITLYGKNFE